MAPDQKRAVVNMSDEQHARIQKAADDLGISVPAYCKIAALEKAKRDV